MLGSAALKNFVETRRQGSVDLLRISNEAVESAMPNIGIRKEAVIEALSEHRDMVRSRAVMSSIFVLGAAAAMLDGAFAVAALVVLLGATFLGISETTRSREIRWRWNLTLKQLGEIEREIRRRVDEAKAKMRAARARDGRP